MDEFSLIEEVVKQLGDRAQGKWVDIGPGDDAAVIAQTPGCDAVASIDTLVGGVHFPLAANPVDIGYRAMMVSLSDLAAMAAEPRYALVALTLPAGDAEWAGALARGMAEAAAECQTYVCGGNFSKGALSITVSVHGEVPSGEAVTRAGACVGDKIYVSGDIGGAAACVRRQDWDFSPPLDPGQMRYLRPRARFDLCQRLRQSAHAAIDVSDGLVADLGHICARSGVGALLEQAAIPVSPGAGLEDALYGGDDYQILCTANVDLPGFNCIGEIVADGGMWMAGVKLEPRGYNHFGAAS